MMVWNAVIYILTLTIAWRKLVKVLIDKLMKIFNVMYCEFRKRNTFLTRIILKPNSRLLTNWIISGQNKTD